MNRSSTLSSPLALSLLVFALLACSLGGKEFSFPEDKKDYVGDWRGKSQNVTMTLSIAADGTVNYERKQGTSGTISTDNSKTISGGKITKFNGNDFEVKVLVVSTTFKVEKPPYRDGNRWKMVVDGVEVSRKDASEVSIDIAEMRKDDGSGKMSDDVSDTFSRDDKTIHTYIKLDNPKIGTRIKIVTIAVNAGGAENRQISEFSVVLKNEFDDEVRSHLTLHKPLPKGDYKVDIYFDEKLESSVPFKVM